MGKSSKEPGMTRLEELELQRGLRDLIREYIDTLYPSSNGTAMLIGRHSPAFPSGTDKRGRSEEFIMIRAIVYLDANKSTWKMVAQSSRAQYGIIPALQEFSKDLEREMANMADNGRKRKRIGLLEDDDYYSEEREKKLRE